MENITQRLHLSNTFNPKTNEATDIGKWSEAI